MIKKRNQMIMTMMMDAHSVKMILFIFLIFVTACAKPDPAMDAFVQCLTDNGAVMYSSMTCSHCHNNKQMFGPSVKHLNYVECHPQGPNNQAELCLQKGVDRYPTWEYGDGSFAIGEQNLWQLSQKTGCVLDG